MMTLSNSARTHMVLIAGLIFSSLMTAFAEEQRDVAVYEDCNNASCPIFQVVIKHQEKATSSRNPGPLVRATPPMTPTRPVMRSPAPSSSSIPVTAPASTTPITHTPTISTPEQKPSLDLTYGLYIASDAVECSKTAIVPSAVFKAVTAVLSSVKDNIDHNGSTAPALTPVQQTMLLFYTTIMQQTLNFDCSFSGATLGRPSGGS
jgi:hypothetical protein